MMTGYAISLVVHPFIQPQPVEARFLAPIARMWNRKSKVKGLITECYNAMEMKQAIKQWNGAETRNEIGMKQEIEWK